jgi:SOS-response transcriptional repressor LexA
MSPERIVPRLTFEREFVPKLSDTDIEARSVPVELPQDLYDTIMAYFDLAERHGRPPTLRELAKELDVSSTNTVSLRVKQLVKKECLEVKARKSHGLWPKVEPEDISLSREE